MTQTIQAAAPSLPELFSAVAAAISRLAGSGGEATLREKVAIGGETLDGLLREWAQRLVDFAQNERLVFHAFDIQVSDHGTRLQAEMIGGWLDEKPWRDVQVIAVKMTSTSNGYQVFMDLKGSDAAV